MQEWYLNSTDKNLDEHLKNELNHEEPPWRTPVTKGWWDRMKDERIRWALRWFRWRFRQNSRGNWTPEKKRWETLGTRIYSWRTNSEGKDYSLGWNKNKIYCMLNLRTNSEGKDYSLGWNKNKIYCMLILHQIKLLTSNGFRILLILLEKKELNHPEEIRIRFIVCLSFTNLDWWQAMDLAYYLFPLKE